ncbi:MAG: carboxymuconolactone decarboxylase family protein [Chloroflexota bacterium]
MTDDQLNAMDQWRQTDLFSQGGRAVLELSEAATLTTPDVSDELFARLQQHFSEAQIVELAGEIAFENFRARFNRIFDIELPARHS